MKATAVAPSNIAFIKYWGKQDEDLRLPLNDSISVNLSGAFTSTTVEFSSEYQADTVELIGEGFSEKEKNKVIRALDRIRQRAKGNDRARVMTKNSFPKGAGAAASASGFAALTAAGFAAIGQMLSEKELTVFARMGSGSGCRSIPDGYVLWKQGVTSEESYAYSLYPHTYWDLHDLLVIVNRDMKKVSTTDGQKHALTSPFLHARLLTIPQKVTHLQHIFKEKNFFALGELIEEECVNMHSVMMTQVPPLFYWNDATLRIMHAVRQWRNDGVFAYFTIDAGPNVHVICEGTSALEVEKRIQSLAGVLQIIHNTPAPGTRLTENHLF